MTTINNQLTLVGGLARGIADSSEMGEWLEVMLTAVRWGSG